MHARIAGVAALVTCGALLGQGVPKKSTRPKLPSEKAIERIIKENRTSATPPSVKSRGPLGPWEVERVKVFQTAKPSVVFVTTFQNLQVVSGPDAGKRHRQPRGSGSGFVWDDGGHVVTNFHVVKEVIEQGDELEVTLVDGKSYKANVIGHSALFDTAILHVFAPLASLKPLQLGRSADLQVGQSVLAIGNPFGWDHSMTSGIVSALNRTVATSSSTTIPGVIQIDAAINPGNSGGPLLDSAGRLIGMNTAIAPVTGASVGIGFSIPVDTLSRVVPVLIAEGQLKRPYLGFTALPGEIAFALTGLRQGLIPYEVDPGGPAALAGLQPWGLDSNQDPRQVTSVGDVILRVNGHVCTDEVAFLAQLEALAPGKPLVLDVLRGGQVIQLTLDPTPERKNATKNPSI